MRYRKIDLDTYPRRSHFAYFLSYANPYVGMTAQVDVTGLRAAVSARGESFFTACLYAAARAANAIPELRQRIDGDGIIEYENCPTSHTVPLADGTYRYCEMDCRAPYASFARAAAEKKREATLEHGIPVDADERALLFVSCIPWESYTAIVQPTPIPADSNPRITFGKYFPQEGRLLMPLTLLANHALVDGLHIARFFERFRAEAALLSETPAPG